MYSSRYLSPNPEYYTFKTKEVAFYTTLSLYVGSLSLSLSLLLYLPLSLSLFFFFFSIYLSTCLSLSSTCSYKSVFLNFCPAYFYFNLYFVSLALPPPPPTHTLSLSLSLSFSFYIPFYLFFSVFYMFQSICVFLPLSPSLPLLCLSPSHLPTWIYFKFLSLKAIMVIC